MENRVIMELGFDNVLLMDVGADSDHASKSESMTSESKETRRNRDLHRDLSMSDLITYMVENP